NKRAHDGKDLRMTRKHEVTEPRLPPLIERCEVENGRRLHRVSHHRQPPVHVRNILVSLLGDGGPTRKASRSPSVARRAETKAALPLRVKGIEKNNVEPNDTAPPAAYRNALLRETPLDRTSRACYSVATSARQSSRSGMPGFRSPKNCTMKAPSASNTSNAVTGPSTVGLTTMNASA